MISLRRRSTNRLAPLGTSARTSACAARSSGWVRSRTASRSSDEPQLLSRGGEHVARVELAATARLDLAVHAHPPLRDQRLRLAARVDYAGDLQQLAEPNRVAPDLHFAHAPHGSGRQAASRTATSVCLRVARARPLSDVRRETSSFSASARAT